MTNDTSAGAVEKPSSLRHALSAFLHALRSHLGTRARGVAALIALAAVFEGAGIALLIPILALALGNGGDMIARMLAATGVAGTGNQLGVLLALFLALMTVRAVVLFRRDLELAALQTGFIADVRNRVMRALAAAPWERVVALRHARVVSLLGEDIGRVAQTTHLVVQAVVALTMLVVQLLLAAVLSPTIAAGAAIVLAAGFIRLLAHARHARHRGADVVGAQLRLVQETGGFLGGLKAAAVEDATPRFVADFAAGQAELAAHHLSFVRAHAYSRALLSLGSAGAAAAIVAAGVAMAVPGPTLAALLVLFARLAGPVSTLQTAITSAAFGLPSFEAIRSLEIELAHDAPLPVAARVPPQGDITLANVRYLHPGGGGIVEATLTIRPGEIIGIFGASGAGKTTLVDLVTGLLPPQAGVISVGDLPLDDAARAGWRRCVAYVAQDSFLPHASVRAVVDPTRAADDDALARVLALTGADAVVAALPEGLQTLIGERGARLSGGQRQRLAIARALLRQPRLLILDEATGAIDIAGEAAILDALARLSPRPTILIVAHRRESLARCDRVLVVENGRVAD